MLEVESKFQVVAPQVFDWIRSQKHVAGYVLSDQKITRQRDTYLDTNAGRLFHHGASLRVREKEGAYFVTFKAHIEGVHVRKEIETPITESQAHHLLNGKLMKADVEAVRAAMPHLKRGKIYPILRIENTREAWYVNSPAGLAKICFDNIQYTDLDGGRCIADYELELELQAGEQIFLRKIAQALSEEYDLRVYHRSKYERGVELLNVFPVGANTGRL